MILATSNSNSNSNKQQVGGLHSISRVRRSPETPNLGRSFPYLRRSYPPSLGPQLLGGASRRPHLLLKMAKNGPLEAEMGPKGAKTAQNGPKCPQRYSNPRKKVPLRKATLSPCVWTPNPGRRWSATTKLLKMAKNGSKQSQRGLNAPKMTPNL